MYFYLHFDVIEEISISIIFNPPSDSLQIYIFYKRRTLRTRMRHERGYNYSNGYYNECDDDNSSFDEFIRNDSKIAYDEEIRRNSKESKSTISSTEITNST